MRGTLRRSIEEWLHRENIDHLREQLDHAAENQRAGLWQSLHDEEEALRRLLLSPEQLRDESRALVKAARNENAMDAKRRLAGRALELALLAEAMVRSAEPGEMPRTQPDLEANRIRRWRHRAEELRAIADQSRLAETQRSLRRIAVTYERLADDAEAMLNPMTPPTPDAS